MKAEKLEMEQLEQVSGGCSEENSNGFRKTCPLCDTFSKIPTIFLRFSHGFPTFPAVACDPQLRGRAAEEKGGKVRR